MKDIDIVKLPTSDFGEVIKYKVHIDQHIYAALLDPEGVVTVVGFCEPEHSIVPVKNVENVSNSKNTEIACVVCHEPIDSHCGKCEECNRLFHLTCTQLPRAVDDPRETSYESLFKWPPPRKIKLELSRLRNGWSRIKCYACGLNFSGYFYGNDQISTRIDVKCALLPTWVMHKAHRHPLKLSDGYRNPNAQCRSCAKLGLSLYYHCRDCNFYLDHQCVTLPESVKHRWDKHPLLLSFPPFFDRPGEFYCEVCEGEIHPKLWHYYCRECDRSFHPFCIPGIVYRNCTFGVTFKYDKHQHPLKLVWEGDYHSKCDSCGESMYDKCVFECASCRFYLCFTCASGTGHSEQFLG